MSINTSPTYEVEMCWSRTKYNLKFPMFLYKFTDTDNTLKCYKFRTVKRCANMDFPLRCCGCDAVRDVGVRMRHIIRTRRTDGSKMLWNPYIEHIPNCHPMEYEKVLLTTWPVTDVVRDKIINGEDISMHLRPPGLLFRNPNDAAVAEATADTHDATVDGQPLVKENVVSRPDLKDPQSVTSGNAVVKTENDSTDPVAAAQDVVFAKKIMSRETLSSILPRNDITNAESQGDVPFAESTADTPDDTADRQPLVKENVVSPPDAENPPSVTSGNAIVKTEEDDADAIAADRDVIFAGKITSRKGKRLSSVPLTNNTSRNDTELHGSFERAIKSDSSEQPMLAESNHLTRSSSFSTNVATAPTITVKAEEDTPLYIDLETDSIIGEPNEKRPRLLPDSNRKTSLDETARLPISTTSPQAVHPSQENSTRKVQMAPPMEFKKTIDAMMFNEDDAEVSVEDGTVLRVVFERKTTSSDRSRSSLRLIHEFDLPDYVDRDSLHTSWSDAMLTVRANTKNSGSLG